MTLLLCNDDGFDAPGLAALERAARALGDPIVVAPAGPQSCMSHAVTMERALWAEERAPGRWAVDGTPADCARLGLLRIAPGAKWVLSGINHGGNLGADVHYSGTVAAVREAALHGWPGVAVSHYRARGREFDWERVVPWVARVLGELLARPAEPGLFYNVNLPHLAPDAPEPEVIHCPLDPHPLPLSFRHEEPGRHLYDGNYQARRRASGADVDQCFGGRITVTAVRLF